MAVVLGELDGLVSRLKDSIRQLEMENKNLKARLDEKVRSEKMEFQSPLSSKSQLEAAWVQVRAPHIALTIQREAPRVGTQCFLFLEATDNNADLDMKWTFSRANVKIMSPRGKVTPLILEREITNKRMFAGFRAMIPGKFVIIGSIGDVQLQSKTVEFLPAILCPRRCTITRREKTPVRQGECISFTINAKGEEDQSSTITLSDISIQVIGSGNVLLHELHPDKPGVFSLILSVTGDRSVRFKFSVQQFYLPQVHELSFVDPISTPSTTTKTDTTPVDSTVEDTGKTWDEDDMMERDSVDLEDEELEDKMCVDKAEPATNENKESKKDEEKKKEERVQKKQLVGAKVEDVKEKETNVSKQSAAGSTPGSKSETRKNLGNSSSGWLVNSVVGRAARKTANSVSMKAGAKFKSVSGKGGEIEVFDSSDDSDHDGDEGRADLPKEIDQEKLLDNTVSGEMNHNDKTAIASYKPDSISDSYQETSSKLLKLSFKVYKDYTSVGDDNGYATEEGCCDGDVNGWGKWTAKNAAVVYEGEWKDDLPNGKGHLKTSDGIEFEGTFVNSELDGPGRLCRWIGSEKVSCIEGTWKGNMLCGICSKFFADGRNVFQTGTFSNDKLNGEGEEYTKKGNLFYKGDFHEGFFHGVGRTYLVNQKVRYEGSFQNGEENGFGKYYFKEDGEYYEGQWKARKWHGMGKYFKEGRLNYEGFFVDDKFHGKGILWADDGKVFEGDFVNDEMNGQGTVTYPGGHKYVGSLRKSSRCGQGKLFVGDELVYDGEWKRDIRSGEGSEFKKGKLMYKGGWKDDRRYGEGTQYHRNGVRRYEGQWQGGMRHGSGVSYYRSGKVKIRGTWRSNVLHGNYTLFTEDGECIESDSLRMEPDRRISSTDRLSTSSQDVRRTTRSASQQESSEIPETAQNEQPPAKRIRTE